MKAAISAASAANVSTPAVRAARGFQLNARNSTETKIATGSNSPPAMTITIASATGDSILIKRELDPKRPASTVATPPKKYVRTYDYSKNHEADSYLHLFVPR